MEHADSSVADQLEREEVISSPVALPPYQQQRSATGSPASLSSPPQLPPNQRPPQFGAPASVASGNTVRSATSTTNQSAFSDVTMTAANATPLGNNPWFQRFATAERGGGGRGGGQQQMQPPPWSRNNINNNNMGGEGGSPPSYSSEATPQQPFSMMGRGGYQQQQQPQQQQQQAPNPFFRDPGWNGSNDTKLSTPTGFHANTPTMKQQQQHSSSAPVLPNPFVSSSNGGYNNNNNTSSSNWRKDHSGNFGSSELSRRDQQQQLQPALPPNSNNNNKDKSTIKQFPSATLFDAAKDQDKVVVASREQVHISRFPPRESTSKVASRQWRSLPRARDLAGGRAPLGGASLVEKPSLRNAARCHAPCMACHSTAVVGDFLLLIGGAMGDQQILDTFGLHLPSQQWYKLSYLAGVAPRGRISPTSVVMRVSRTAESAARLIPAQDPIDVVVVFGGCIKRAATDSSLRVVTVSFLHSTGQLCWGGTREDGGASSSLAHAAAVASAGGGAGGGGGGGGSYSPVPAHRRGHSAFTRGEDRMVIVGGRGDDGTLFDDMWELTLEFGASSSPIATAVSNMELHQQQQEQQQRSPTRSSSKSGLSETQEEESILSSALLTGMQRPGVAFIATWKQISFANKKKNNGESSSSSCCRRTPAPRHGHSTAFIAATDRCYLFGGEVSDPSLDLAFHSLANDLWEFDFTTSMWREIDVLVAPPPRYAQIMWTERVEKKKNNNMDNKSNDDEDGSESCVSAAATTTATTETIHRIYIHGGDDHDKYYSDVWSIDICDQQQKSCNNNGSDDEGDDLLDNDHEPAAWDCVVAHGDGPFGRSGHAQFYAPRNLFTDGGVGLPSSVATLEQARSHLLPRNGTTTTTTAASAVAAAEESESDRHKRLLQKQEHQQSQLLPFMYGGEMMLGKNSSDSIHRYSGEHPPPPSCDMLGFSAECFAWSSSPVAVEKGSVVPPPPLSSEPAAAATTNTNTSSSAKGSSTATVRSAALSWFSQATGIGSTQGRCDLLQEMSVCLPRAVIAAVEQDTEASMRALDPKRESVKVIPFNFPMDPQIVAMRNAQQH